LRHDPRIASTLARTLFSTVHGTVSIYTRRHIHGCQLRSPDDNRCACPKWIYAKARDGRASQQAANTPSFTEACELALKILKGFDPEIQAAREIIARTEVCCVIHPATKMVCPRCIAAKGGRATARTHSHAELAAYGRMGGRPKKQS
jgi:hypothetical protein